MPKGSGSDVATYPQIRFFVVVEIVDFLFSFAEENRKTSGLLLFISPSETTFQVSGNQFDYFQKRKSRREVQRRRVAAFRWPMAGRMAVRHSEIIFRPQLGFFFGVLGRQVYRGRRGYFVDFQRNQIAKKTGNFQTFPQKKKMAIMADILFAKIAFSCSSDSISVAPQVTVCERASFTEFYRVLPSFTEFSAPCSRCRVKKNSKGKMK